MKTYSIIKTGYTRGIYGCSNEYFNLIISDDKGLHNLQFYGMYGTEERVSRVMTDNKYTNMYLSTTYGQLKRDDIAKKQLMSEQQAIEYIQRGFKQSKEEIEKEKKELEKIVASFQTV